MELVALIFFLWLIGCLFPGSGGGYVDIAGAFACLIAGIVVLGGLYLYWAFSMVGILWLGEWLNIDNSSGLGGAWLLFAFLGPIAIPMIIAGTINGIRDSRAAS